MIREHTQGVTLKLKNSTIVLLDNMVEHGIIKNREQAVESCLSMYLPSLRNVQLFRKAFEKDIQAEMEERNACSMVIDVLKSYRELVKKADSIDVVVDSISRMIHRLENEKIDTF